MFAITVTSVEKEEFR